MNIWLYFTLSEYDYNLSFAFQIDDMSFTNMGAIYKSDAATHSRKTCVDT